MLLKSTIYLLCTAVFLWTVVPTLRSYGASAHKRAIHKFFFMWLLSTLPIIVSVALAPSQSLSWNYVVEMSGSPFSMSEQLIYACAFLSPVLFVFVEAIQSFINDNDEARMRRFKHALKTFYRVLLPSLVLMLVGMAMYAGIKTDSENFKLTTFYQIVGNKAVVIYGLSLVYWYCLLVIEGSDEVDYVIKTTRQTADFTKQARDRIGGGA